MCYYILIYSYYEFIRINTGRNSIFTENDIKILGFSSILILIVEDIFQATYQNVAGEPSNMLENISL